MKKQYFKPQTDCVKVNLYGSVLDKGETLAGQSNNPVGKPNPGDVEWSGKGDAFSDDEDENPMGGNSYNIWNDR
ncbi:MAG: hypothetical protein PUG75_02305 [Prevotella sp.]|nr:hypothetical protein [Prevotella sp.]MDY5258381.1 hypothetical protein [Prevotella sp.]